MDSFRTQNGRALVFDMDMVVRAAKAKVIKSLSIKLKKIMVKQVEDVIAHVDRQLVNSGYQLREQKYAGTTLTIDTFTNMWEDALKEVLQEHDLHVALQNAAQSVADTVHVIHVPLLTGVSRTTDQAAMVTRHVASMPFPIQGINDTTRNRLLTLLQKELDKGEHPFAVMEKVRKKFPEIPTGRVPTIVRTEMGRAADLGALQAMRDSQVVTHVSVVGCEAIEKGIPTWNGIPTCNIKNVPLESSGELRFHPNHTGSIIASGFRHLDGAAPNLAPAGGDGIGTWEARGRPVPANTNEVFPDLAPPVPVTPPVPLLPPKPPEPPKPVTVPRKAEGHLADDWQVPKTRKEIDAMVKELIRNGVDLEVDLSSNGYFNISEYKYTDTEEIIRALSYVKEKIGMSPLAWHKLALKDLESTNAKSMKTALSFFSSRAGADTFLWTGHSIDFGDGSDLGRVMRGYAKNSVTGKITAEHSELTLPEEHQGSGLAKIISNNYLDLHDHLNVSSVTADANIDAGAYAWLRYGFVPEQDGWDAFKADMYSQWKGIKENLGQGSVGTLTKEEIDEIELVMDAVVRSDDPYSARAIAGLSHKLSNKDNPRADTVGKHILQNRSYKAVMDLDNEKDYSTYRRYMDRK